MFKVTKVDFSTENSFLMDNERIEKVQEKIRHLGNYTLHCINHDFFIQK